MKASSKPAKAPPSKTTAGAARASAPPAQESGALLELQRAAGNRAVRSLLSTPQATAARGTGGAGGSLPHLQRIQASFGRHDVSRVQAFTGGAAASAAGALGAQAFAYGDRIAFASRPDLRTAAHEAAHVVQQRTGAHPAGGLDRPGDRFERHADAVADAVVAGRSAERLLDTLGTGRSVAASVQRQPRADKAGAKPRYPIGMYAYRGRYYSVGMSAGVHLLIGIEVDEDNNASFTWANFRTNETYVSDADVWDQIYRAYHPTPPPQHSLDPWQRYKGTHYADPYVDVAVALGSSDLHKLVKTPAKAVLDAHEAGKLALPTQGVLSAYEGLLDSEALRSLAENEKSVDALLNQPDRMQKLEEYATQLKEASFVRDELIKRRDELRSSRPGGHAPTIGLPKTTGTLVDPGRLMRIGFELHEVETALAFWYESFPLLTRIQTAELRGTRVEMELRLIKANIVATRQRVIDGRNSSSLDLWDLDNVRAAVAESLGPRVKGVVAAEDARRASAHRASSLLLGALTIGLLFLPGGIFLDAAIGVAIAAKAWSDAKVIGQAANTSMHVDHGLMSRARASAAVFDAVLATVFAVLGSAAAGLSVLRVGRAYANVARAAPELDLGEQIRVTRLLLKQPALLRAPVRFAELEGILEHLGVRLSVAEIRGLRASIFRHLGVEMSPQSVESLQELLELTWARRSRINQADDIYQLYSDAPVPQARLSGDPQVYKQRLDALVRGRRGGFHLQGDPDRGFWMYLREGFTLPQAAERTTERLYLNVAADHAVETMEKVVKDLLDNHSINGVLGAKLAGPAEVGARADAIVIYLENAEASRAVLGRLKALTDANPAHFNPSTPFMTNRMLKGVSAGMEPVGSGGRISFGDIRSQAIFRALRRTTAGHGTQEDFVRFVAEELRRVHVNPAAPHANLAASGGQP